MRDPDGATYCFPKMAFYLFPFALLCVLHNIWKYAMSVLQSFCFKSGRAGVVILHCGIGATGAGRLGCTVSQYNGLFGRLFINGGFQRVNVG